jgi:hypothetical protein
VRDGARHLLALVAGAAAGDEAARDRELAEALEAGGAAGCAVQVGGDAFVAVFGREGEDLGVVSSRGVIRSDMKL